MLKLPDWLKTRITGVGEKLNTQAWKIGEKASKIGQKLNNKKVIMPVALAVWLILGWLVWWKIYTNKNLVKDILGIEEINNWPTYIIDKWKEIKWNPWKWREEDKMLVYFKTPGWDEFMAKLDYSPYYLEFKIYKSINPEWKEIYVVECTNRMEKKDLPKGSVIEDGSEIRYIKSSSSTTWIPYFPQVKDK